jgi:hypothetical protein
MNGQMDAGGDESPTPWGVGQAEKIEIAKVAINSPVEGFRFAKLQ